MVVETFLVVSVTSLDFAVMPRRSRTNELVLNIVLSTKNIKRMCTLCSNKMCKFCTVVSLNCLRSIAEEDNCTFYKVYDGIAAVFLVCVDNMLGFLLW